MKQANEGDTDSQGTQPPWAAALAFTNDPHAEHNFLVSSEYGSVQMATRLLEERIVAHDAMKVPPAKSALDNANLSVAQTGDAVLKMLNQKQRENGANIVTENQSLYQVTLSRPDATGTTDWVGQVAGPPAVYSLKTVNVLAAGTTLIIFDKTNKKLWQATLAYTMAGGDATDPFARETSRFGQGPCVPHQESAQDARPAGMLSRAKSSPPLTLHFPRNILFVFGSLYHGFVAVIITRVTSR